MTSPLESDPLKIAVIGTGAAGLTAAYLLQQKHSVTLFEKSLVAGGHAHTAVLDNGPDKGMPVDMGFSLFNEQGYPSFQKLVSKLHIPVKDTHLSFGYYDEKSRLQYAGTGWNGLFAQRANLFKPSFWGLVPALASFLRRARKDLREGKLSGVTLGEYLEQKGTSPEFIRHLLFPLGAAFWLVSTREMIDFPVETFVGFFEDNGVRGVARPHRWWLVEGGSQTYVKALLKSFRGRVKTSCPVEQISRSPKGVLVQTKDSQEILFDKVVLAVHADEVLPLLQEPTEEESRLFSPWRYSKNNAVLHTDVDVMPPLKRAWASWNYVRETDATLQEPASLTWHVNRIQEIPNREQYFVTFNRVRPIPVRHVLKEMYFTHPVFTRETMESQKELPKLNEVGPIHFCGSYFGRGFHEDAVRSGMDVAKIFGLEL